jgi:arylsulfatase
MFASDNGASAEVVGGSSVVSSGEIGTMTRWASLGENWANVSNTPFRYYKNDSYEGGINTPFIAHWPDHIEPNTKSDFPGHFIDLMATVVDITDAEYPDTVRREEIYPYEGKSLLPVFRGKSLERKEPLFFQWAQGRAVHQGKWKIVKNGLDNPWNLYNMEKDPTETNDLSDKYPDVVSRLDSLHRHWRKRVNQQP